MAKGNASAAVSQAHRASSSIAACWETSEVTV
jgi:hypothetical protein